MAWSRIKRNQAYAPVSGEEQDAQHVHKRSSTLQQLLQPTLTFAAGVVITSIMFLLFGQHSPQRPGSSVATTEFGSTLSPVPELPFTTVVFENNKTFSEHPNFENDIAWNALLPPGRGFVYIDNPKQYNLEPGQSTDWGEIYSVSMFHQIHCLGQLRKAYWTLIDGVESGDTRKSELLVGPHGDHVTHCFDYLRQSIMCAGDMSMEWPRTEPNGDRYAVDGWGIPHQCKSWDAISSYMEKARFNHSMNSGIAP